MADSIRGDQIRFLYTRVFGGDDMAACGDDSICHDEAGAAIEMPLAAIWAFVVTADCECAFAQAIANIRSREFLVRWRCQRDRMAFCANLLAQSRNGFQFAFLQQVGAGADDGGEVSVIIDDEWFWAREPSRKEEQDEQNKQPCHVERAK